MVKNLIHIWLGIGSGSATLKKKLDHMQTTYALGPVCMWRDRHMVEIRIHIWFGVGSGSVTLKKKLDHMQTTDALGPCMYGELLTYGIRNHAGEYSWFLYEMVTQIGAISVICYV